MSITKVLRLVDPDKYSFYHVAYSGYMSSSPLNGYYDVIPAFNLSSSTLVSDNVSGGYYTFMFNEPPVIQTIGNIQGNYQKLGCWI